MKLREASVILLLDLDFELDKNSVKVEVNVNVQVDIKPNLMTLGTGYLMSPLYIEV